MRQINGQTFALFLIFWCVQTPRSVWAQEAHSITPEQSFFEWTEMKQDAVIYQHRRDRMYSELAKDGIELFIIPGEHGVSHGFTFRQTDDFLYFTGLELPYSILVLNARKRAATIYAPPRDARFESQTRANDFPGRPLADDRSLAEKAMVDDLIPYNEFGQNISEWIAEERSIAVNGGRTGPITAPQTDFIMDWNPVSSLVDYVLALFPEAKFRNAYRAVARLRMVKQAEEIETMRRVAALTVHAIRHAAGFVTDGIDERSLEAELEAVYKRGGAQRLSFSSIVKSGPNSLWPWRILAAHHDRRNRVMHDGELVIFDVGTELDYYISDVGRTFPVSGTFTAEQREKMEMSIAVSDAIIQAVRPGITLPELKKIAVEATPVHERRYMQTGSFFGHHIGMSSGDPNLIDTPLQPGMVFTVEPWYYNHDDGISVFTEDMILVTENGADILTAGLPRSPSELEELVRRE